MPSHPSAHHYEDDDSDSDASTITSSGSDDDDEKAPIKHRRQYHEHPKEHRFAAAPDNRIWLALAMVILSVAVVVAGYYVYHKQLSASTGASGSTGGLFGGSSGGSPSGSDPAGLDNSADTSSSGSGTGNPDTGAAGGSGSGGSSGGGNSGTSAGAGPSGATAGGSAGNGTATSAKTAAATNSPKPSAGAGGGGTSSAGGPHAVAGFWENWVGASVADTDFAAYTHAFWFVAAPGTAAEKGKLDLKEAKEGMAKDWVQAAKKANCKAMLSIGGWDASNTFSSLVATEQSRSDFVATIATALDSYGFDGCDLDWEYPGRAGATQDFDVKNDLNNFLAFIKALRAKLGKDMLISADTSSTPWVGPDGNPSTDLSAFAAEMDFITIMTYDAVTYSSKTTGPNFAYEDTCAPAAQKFNIPKAVKSWTDAKFPANKIMLGIATYGYAWKVASVKDGGGTDGATSSIYQTAASTLSAGDAAYKFDKISPLLSSMDRTFDKCSSTPFIYSSSSQLFIAYDDEDSIKIKGGYAGKNGLMGCSLYAGLTQDKDSSLAKVAKTVC
ncbi:hypothetical protein JCM10908_003280 [Rhodotorula pacifica]|uniref:glycoside hydrolase family 18 protein n=1 Tax=Rhodotorula pacifica TaxID=1495444 RepID=UPI0031780BA5